MGLDLLQDVNRTLEPDFSTPNPDKLADTRQEGPTPPIPRMQLSSRDILSALRNLPSDQNETSPELSFVADGAKYQQQVFFQPRSLFVENFSTMPFILSFDDGSQFEVWVGALFMMLPPATRWIYAQSTGTGVGKLVVVPFDRRADLFYGGVNQPQAATAPQEHIFNGAINGTTVQMAIPFRPNGRVSATIVNESNTNIRAGNHADGISSTVGELIAASGGSANFIGSEQIDVCGIGAGILNYSGCEAYN